MFLYKNKLIDLRESCNFTHKEMAKISSTSRPNYSRWENGREFIPLNKLNIYANHFNVSMDYIFCLTKKKQYNDIESIDILDRKIVGERLRSFRKNFKITQVKLAEYLNTTHSTISAYESGKTLILTSFAIQICSKYGISLDWLCGRKKEESLFIKKSS